MARQMRRYELHPEHEERFLTWWQKIPAARKGFGFTVLSAHIDRVNHEFTWIVEHEGDLDAFVAAETAWMTSPERVELFAGEPKHSAQIHVSMVDQVF